MRILTTLCVVLSVAVGAARADDTMSAFYKGKTVSIIVGSAAGGGYDAYARLISRHLGKHIPGSPSVIVSNMPGAGGNVAATYVYNGAAKDGTVIGAFQSNVILQPLLGKTAVKHDPSKFFYLGSANDDVYICVAKRSAVHSFSEVFSKKVILAAASSSSTSEYAEVINGVLGTKFEIVNGYPGSKDIAMAIDKSEAQGVCGVAWPAISVTQSEWFPQGAISDDVQVIAQMHDRGHPDLNRLGVPLVTHFAKTDEQRRLLDFYFSQSRFGRPYLVAPDVPDDRATMLRDAFKATLEDPDLRAEAAKLRLDVDYLDGGTVQDAVRRAFASPPDIVAKVKAILNPH
jgi:tripartite-type tricarboxylate transporter receptor subunit TctC